MGTWGEGPFDNDAAQDWLDSLWENDDAFTQLFNTLVHAAETPEEDYLDVDDGQAAVAAAEVVAVLLGNVDPKRPPVPDLADWVKANGHLFRDDLFVEEDEAEPSDALFSTLARAALMRVTGPQSELKALWAEGADKAWALSVERLNVRLG